MSNIWISAGTTPHVPGPQAQTIIETVKVQAIPAISALNNYQNVKTDSESEAARVQASPVITALNYV